MLPEVQSIIFATMPVGINHIKDDGTAIKFFSRYLAWNYARGYEPYFDLAKVREMVGLSTNASSKTDAAFRKELLDAIDRRVVTEVEKHNYKRTDENV
jgi:hypothetical protein